MDAIWTLLLFLLIETLIEEKVERPLRFELRGQVVGTAIVSLGFLCRVTPSILLRPQGRTDCLVAAQTRRSSADRASLPVEGLPICECYSSRRRTRRCRSDQWPHLSPERAHA